MPICCWLCIVHSCEGLDSPVILLVALLGRQPELRPNTHLAQGETGVPHTSQVSADTQPDWRSTFLVILVLRYARF